MWSAISDDPEWATQGAMTFEMRRAMPVAIRGEMKSGTPSEMGPEMRSEIAGATRLLTKPEPLTHTTMGR
jgi:hypothetical protein